ncbi:hypothetical protein ACHAXS_007044 [Conticribra weissflogii]
MNNKGRSENEWSDDDDDDDDDNVAANEHKMNVTMMQKRQKIMGGIEYTTSVVMDEFSGGLGFDDTDDYSNDEIHDACDYGSHMEESKIDLDGDIVFNLSVLSRIFPGENIENQQLKAPPKASEHGGFSQTASSEISAAAFGSGLIMQRYDPTKESAKKFEITQIKASTAKFSEKKTENVGEMKCEETDATSESSEKDKFGKGKDDGSSEPERAYNIESDNEMSKELSSTPVGLNYKQSKIASNDEENMEPKEDVYEEAKLEDIFKKARDGKSETFTFASMFQNDQNTSQPDEEGKGDIYEQDKLEEIFKRARDDNTNGSSNFASGEIFNHQIPESRMNDVENGTDKISGSFSFGFGFANQDESEENPDQKIPEKKNEIEVNHRLASQLSGESMVNSFYPLKRRVGLTFPEEDLDIYVERFFRLNEGPRILEDLEAMRNDPENQDLWQKERQTLTADWKRKQKQALSRKGKKNRLDLPRF